MPETLYVRAQVIAHELLELPADGRQLELDRHCGDDAQLRAEVQWLLSASEDCSLDAIPPTITAAAAALDSDLRIESSTPGRYRLLQRLGEGGMGVVWLAEREVGGVPQRVALKHLRVSATAQRSRFKEEQRILAALNHPNIAHLIDAGEDGDGTPFLAMEYIEGERIDHWCNSRQLSLRARIELFIKVCAAVSYAHERLIIHRDVKPANILVHSNGEPKLLDFGIARLLVEDAATLTATRGMTPAYASPEQIEGAPLGTATDIWSLGVVLYELLAGVRPFEHISNDLGRAQAVLNDAVAPPSQQLQRNTAASSSNHSSLRQPARRIPADIDAIVLKALRRKPEQRYASVRELAEDLASFLAARPVQARRGRWTYRAQRFMQRYRWPLAAALTLVTVIVGFSWRTLLAEQEARLQAQVAERTTEFLVSTFALSDPTQAARHDFSARDVLDRGRARVDEELADQPRVRARLLEALGNAYRGLNEGSAGVALLEAAAQLNLDPAVNDPLAAARSLRAKAHGILAANGSSEQAEDAAQRAFDLVIAANQGDLQLAEAHGTLARALDSAGKHVEAVAAAERALALREAAAAAPLEMADSMSELCSVVSGSSEYSKALPYCERARALYAEAGKTRTNAYRVLLHKLEGVLWYTGEYDQKLMINRERIALTRDLFGEDSAQLALDQVNFSMILSERGLFDEAAALLAAAIPVTLQRNGPHSTQYAMAQFNAGWLQYQLGEFDAAATLLREAVQTYERVVDGRDNNRLQVLRVTMSMALLETGPTDDEAARLLRRVIAERAAADANTTGLAYARLPLAHWKLIQGRYDEADRLLDQVEAVGSNVEPELHARAAATRAAIQHARGDPAGAMQQEQAAYIISLADGAQHPRTARYALIYARSLRASGDIQQAQALEQEYRPILEAAYPPTSAHRNLLGTSQAQRTGPG